MIAKTMRVEDTIRILERAYGMPKPGKPENPLDSLVETILSQNTNDLNRDRAFENLKKIFPHWDNVMSASRNKLAAAIRVGGLANIKSSRIKAILKEIKAKTGKFSLDYLREMPAEDAVQQLMSFKGVGEKTAKCVLLFSLGKSAFPVDTHIHRLCRRMGFVRRNASREETHRIMAEIVPEKKMYSFHINLIRHGRKTCTARKPDCANCPLTKACPKII